MKYIKYILLQSIFFTTLNLFALTDDEKSLFISIENKLPNRQDCYEISIILEILSAKSALTVDTANEIASFISASLVAV